MMYKIMHDNRVIDAVEHPEFIKFLRSGHISFTDKTSAHGILGSDRKTIYVFAPQPGRDFQIVSIEAISADELNSLSGLLSSGQLVSADESALTNAKEGRLSVLSSICKNTSSSSMVYLWLSSNCLLNSSLAIMAKVGIIIVTGQILPRPSLS